ncbi:MAG: hypothetical protein BroJett005_19790 [Ignavibacteriota bacterium]|nr:MAG: hypothetical protein BroJett005_19790 [Ignavibacteriota bacterium]
MIIPSPPINNLKIIAKAAETDPDNGPKTKAHKLITINRPSNIIPSVKLKGTDIPIIAVIPNNSPCNLFPHEV